MDRQLPFGLCLYQKDKKATKVLKDLLQLLRSTSPTRNISFFYVEADALIPNLSLWENLQMGTGHSSWTEFTQSLSNQERNLARLIRDPYNQSQQAEAWEKFIISFLKGLSTGSHLLIDVDETLLPIFIVQGLKELIVKTTHERKIFLATASTGLWLDCAHSLVEKKQFHFESKTFDAEALKKNWAA
jgi:hypothetical protein